MNVAFIAPLKPPDHPEPSGDREMARLFLAALARGGAHTALVSRLRLFDRTGSDTPKLADLARAEADRWIGRVRAGKVAVPDLVFTYHVYYKAPDVIGPRIASAFGIPYVIAEGSRAPKRGGGPWDAGHRLAEAALDAADLVLVLNDRDREVLERLHPSRQRIERFPPFIDASAWPEAQRPIHRAGGPLRLLTVAMMRPGDKLASYRMLAHALDQVDATAWTLTVVGDGEAGYTVAQAFSGFGDRVRFLGRVDERSALADHYANADCLVWPAVNEAFGMVFLEAALQGCPSLAGAYGGVPGVVVDGVTGRLAEPGSAASFATILTELASDRDGLRRLGQGARRFARFERDLDTAAQHLLGLLEACLTTRSAT